MIHASSTLLVTPPVDFLSAARRYIKPRAAKQYAAQEVDYIVSLYADVCRAGEVDVEFAITQMVHETAALSSDWASPSKRNPAGLDVTGEPGRGLIFDTWSDAVEAHIGLILCYRFPAGQGSPAQQRLINEFLVHKPSPPRGFAKTVADLAAKWAADPAYVPALVRVNEAIAAA